MTNNIAKMIDHTLLKPEATKSQIQSLCEEAREYSFASVCVNIQHGLNMQQIFYKVQM